MAIADSEDREREGAMATAAAFFRDERRRSFMLQALTLGLVAFGLWYLTTTTMENLQARSMSAGFGFLDSNAGFSIGFTLIDYKENDSYLRVFWVGVANTMLVAVISIFFATVLGLLVGLARLSQNWLISRLARSYVEILRNTPLLLQIIAWFFCVFNLLPRPKQSLVWGDAFVLNNRGFYMPAPLPEPAFWAVAGTFFAGVGFAIWFSRWAKAKADATGDAPPVFAIGAAAIVLAPLLVFLATGMPLAWEAPVLKGFNYRGGLEVPPSFCALVVALSVYTSCFIAEIVRAGIQSVPRGQHEAAGALNLSHGWKMRRIVLPQAMRVIIPPLISNYLNVTKNSSLAIAVGFPDLVSVWMNTALNQSGRAIPIVAMTMAFYCTVSLTVSVILNWYNARVQIKER
ncbi:MAG: amino acid ABC transporter permease [Pseudomonadota bacterium]